MEKNLSTYIQFETEEDFQKILTNPILDIAARFWEPKRYEAFKICYRSMRVIDDLVDDPKAAIKELSDSDKKQIHQMITNWTEHLSNGQAIDDFQKQLLDTIDEFKIPLWPWQRLAQAMIFDLYHNSFDSFLIFRRYSEGAAISPASIFMHLCGVTNENNKFNAPKYDIRRGALDLAFFSYLVHIIRDIEKDQQAGLNYFSLNMISKYNLTVENLNESILNHQPTEAVRNLIGCYKNYADYYRSKARHRLDQLSPQLSDKYRLSLEIIYNLYNQIFNRIDVETGNFTGLELNPTPDEIKIEISTTIKAFNSR